MDGWLEVKLQAGEEGQQVLAALQTLRNTWSHLLELKLEASKSKFRNAASTNSNGYFLLSILQGIIIVVTATMMTLKKTIQAKYLLWRSS